MTLQALRDFFYPKKTDNSEALLSETQPAIRVSSVFSKAISHSDELPLINKLSKFDFSQRLRIQKIVISFCHNQQEEDRLINWFETIQDSLGEDFLLFVSNPASYLSDTSLDQIGCLLQNLLQIGYDDEETASLLLQFYRSQISLSDLLTEIEVIRGELDTLKYSERSIEESLQAFTISENEQQQINEEYQTLCKLGKQLQQQSVRAWVDYVKQGGKGKLSLLAIAREAIRLKFGIYPYSTQMVTILALLSHPSTLKGRLAQVKTGEGKSTIIAILAFYNAALGYTVDIASTSRYLAKRDWDKYQEFFQTFGFTSSHICEDFPKAENFQKQIIFGTNYDFEFSILRDYLQEKQTRIEIRPFQVMIVDEADNLFIDSALNSARMGIGGRVSFDWVYHPILDFVRQYSEKIDKALKEGDIEDVVNDLRQLLTTISSQTSDLSDEKLGLWLQMAYDALYEYRPNEDFVINPVQEHAILPPKHQIVIVDKKNTGRLKESSRWQNGLHEFLEARYNLPVKEESVTAASISHPAFFNHYERIYGLTGTIGIGIEQREIEAIYHIDTVIVPPHKPNKRQVLEPLLLPTKEEHLQAILAELKHMQSCQRPTLVLFESIRQSGDFAEFLKANDVLSQLLNECQLEDEDFIITRAGMPGVVTLATNTAGRGTDIIIHPLSLENGGLHVIFTFYPQNQRVEDQGFGRAGRQGQIGSARLILHSLIPIDLLESERMRETTFLSMDRLEKSLIETIKHRYLKTFSEQLKQWQKTLDDNFLSSFSEDHIARLMKQGSISDRHSLTRFFQERRSQLREEILQDWSEYFYNSLDDLYIGVKKECQDSTSLQAKYQSAIEKHYQNAQKHWEEKLLSPEKAFLPLF